MRFIKNKLTQILKSDKIKSMFKTIHSTSQGLVTAVDSGMKFETNGLCDHYPCDELERFTFGLDCEVLKNKHHEHRELLEAGNRIF